MSKYNTVAVLVGAYTIGKERIFKGSKGGFCGWGLADHYAPWVKLEGCLVIKMSLFQTAQKKNGIIVDWKIFIIFILNKISLFTL